MWKAYEIILKTDICIFGTEISLDVDAVFHISFLWMLAQDLEAQVASPVLGLNFAFDTWRQLDALKC